MTEVSIIVPLLNEELNLKELHQRIRASMLLASVDFEIIYVDDGSTDKSWQVLNELKDEWTTLIKHKRNFGQTVAMRTGLIEAEGTVIVFMDADLQNDPSDIAFLLDEMVKGDYDCVSGWRKDRKDGFAKRGFSFLSRHLRKLLLNDTLHDSGCTLKAYWKESLLQIELVGEMHRFIPAVMKWKGYRVTELPVKHHPRKAGVTKYGLSRIFRGFLDLIVLAFWQRYSVTPMHFFGILSIVSFGLSFLSGMFSIFQKLFNGIDLTANFLAILSLGLFFFAIQFLTLGVITDIMLKNHRQLTGPENCTEMIVQ